MKIKIRQGDTSKKVIIKKCHVCGFVQESNIEVKKCGKCNKSFLPLNYFEKVHNSNKNTCFDSLFSQSEEIQEEDVIKGIYVIW